MNGLHRLVKHHRMSLLRDKIIEKLFKNIYLKNDILTRLGYNKLDSHRRRLDVRQSDLKLKLERLKIYAEAKHNMFKFRSLHDFRTNFKVNLAYRKCRKLYKT